jgi:hypothetical protein
MTEESKREVLMLTQEYGSKLVDAVGYHILSELDNEKDNKRDAEEILVKIAKLMK